MSDYCGGCRYKVTEKTGVTACPFNYLYWDFLIRNTEKLRGNPRLGMIYATLNKMPPEQRETIIANAKDFLDSVAPPR
jgi:deoxyribodipyrimidine photolyase-related protein